MASWVNAQERTFIQLPNAKQNCASIIINPVTIANAKYLEKYKDDITEMYVQIDKSTRESFDLYNLSSHGILTVDLSVEVATKTQSELNKFFGLPHGSKVFIDGFLLEKPKYKIATKCIVEIKIVEPTRENGLAKKAINVWTLTKEERINGCKL